MVTFENVSYTYQTGMEMSTSTAVLTDVNLHIGKGKCVVLCGRSGCGKTTMLRLVNGLAPHFYAGNLQGAVSVAGMDIPSSDLPEISKIVGSVFQNPRTQFFHMDTTGEMAFNLENQNMPRQQMKQRIEEVAYHLHLEELLERDIFELSGGEKQQIACGSIYASLPEVVVLDEPSSNLDMESIRKLQKLIQTIDPEVLYRNYSIVFQDVTLFDNTVMENIRLGRQNATDEEVLKAAKAARCEEFVSNLPEGYHSMIGENGCTLSGGERQRISIARAILKDAPVIILDEATASMDVENESMV